MINSQDLTGKITLLTRQDIKSLDDLKNNGVIRI